MLPWWTPLGRGDNGKENGIKTKHTEMLWETVLSWRASECARNKAGGEEQSWNRSLQKKKPAKLKRYKGLSGWHWVAARCLWALGKDNLEKNSLKVKALLKILGTYIWVRQGGRIYLVNGKWHYVLGYIPSCHLDHWRSKLCFHIPALWMWLGQLFT